MSRSSASRLVWLLMLVSVSAGVSAMDPPWGPAVGTQVVIAAPDQTGTQRTVGDLAGRNGLLLFLNRSADWCPFCKRQLVQLESERSRFEALGVQVAAMTYDDLEQLRVFHDKSQLGYPLLHDAGAVHVNALGVRNLQYREGHQAYGVPHPGILFLSPEGKVLHKFAVPGYRQRPPIDDVLAAVESDITARRTMEKSAAR